MSVAMHWCTGTMLSAVMDTAVREHTFAILGAKEDHYAIDRNNPQWPNATKLRLRRSMTRT
eukprot:8170393-Lingulodinium_polyedra.AAC.1